MPAKKNRHDETPSSPVSPSPIGRASSLQAFGATIRKCREKMGLTLDAVAARTGISKPYLSNIETARAPGPPSEEKLRLLAGALQLDPRDLLDAADWLRTPPSVRRALETLEKGGPSAPARREDGTLDLDTLVRSPGPNARSSGAGRGGARDAGEDRAGKTGSDQSAREIPLRDVPVINKVPAGAAADFGDMNYPAGVADDYVPAPDLPNAPVRSAFALRVAGDSMAPHYQPGEIIIVAPGNPADGDDAVVRLGPADNFATTFKRIFFIREESEPRALRLVPLNPRHPERVVPIDEVTGIYPLLYRLLPARREATAAADAAPEPAREAAPAPEPREFTSRVSIEHD